MYWYERGGPAGGWEALGELFHYGVHVAPDYEKAALYYTMAAGSCRVLSLYGLGALQAERRLANRDDVEGYKWLLLARWAATNTPGCGQHHDCVHNALKDRRGYRELLRNRLSPEQVVEATARAEQWKRQHPWRRGQVTCDSTSAARRDSTASSQAHRSHFASRSPASWSVFLELLWPSGSTTALTRSRT